MAQRDGALGVIHVPMALEVRNVRGQPIVDVHQSLVEGDARQRRDETLARRAEVVDGVAVVAVVIALGDESLVARDHDGIDARELAVADGIERGGDLVRVQAFGGRRGGRPAIARRRGRE
jgi:hypothetical protein